MNLSPAYEKWHQEAIAEGEARGRNLERIAVVRNMLQEGVAIAFITKITGFSATEIEQLSLEQAQ